MAKPRSRHGGAKARLAATEAAEAAKESNAVAVVTRAANSSSAPKAKGKAAAAAAAEAAAAPVKMSPDQALNSMHWIRQGLALAVGAAMGALQVEGVAGFMTYLVVVVLAPNSFVVSVLGVDESEVEQAGSLKTEGLMPSLALFILLWILMYTTFLPRLYYSLD